MVKVLARPGVDTWWAVWLLHNGDYGTYLPWTGHTLHFGLAADLPGFQASFRVWDYLDLQSALDAFAEWSSSTWRIHSRCHYCFPGGCKVLPI